MSTLSSEASRRRTFAVIAHPDAGKSTLTEALALHAHVIAEAGAVHGKAGRKATVSDWMDMEKDRGISIASSALQFEYAPEGHTGEPFVINLVDTPGHADFSEDTYRVLTAVDAAVMLIDAAKGLEPQTLKLFRVCKARGLPIVTVVNKWDRPGRTPLELVDEIVNEIGLQPTPLFWPVGDAGDFRGLARINADGEATEYIHFLRTAGGSTIAPEEHYSPEEAEQREETTWETAVEEAELLAADGAIHDQDLFLDCTTSPLIFASAMLNFGVHQILDTLCSLAPSPSGRASDTKAVSEATTAIDESRDVTDDFSGVVFKVQAGMDKNHRDSLAFMRIVSGEFDRGMQVTHAQSGRSFSTKYALTVFGRTRSTVETAYPGDIVGLVNAGALAPGDTIFEGRKVQYPPMPQFAPEHFRILRAKSLGKYKQFRKGLDQLAAEGVVQILKNDARGDAAPVMAAVGPMQFEVMMARMENEYNVETVSDPIPYSVARRTTPETATELSKQRGVEVFQRTDGELVALFGDKWKLAFIEKEHPEFELLPMVAD
ncbi:peptide chain release factor 3 [Corynebacterium pseudotuberculosis]|uniref:Peptide chain release factor 3 n=1 Tax=Corynebacterium pseudotuberculosis (strain C231) TaxID=681645 RepID=D9Q9F1_CORP2|nr:peptide chain release factor 3 [Corynebacterium pseudotuberculosis]ADK28490.2 peptide chain release factor 3 [Corynebacterium pseudotuberculosis FRC41]ADL10177.1 peptide chain release factor 3 [Corynebacterium pseudotuberculosis C231]ADL20586.1 peptide chain release factor 3 [Corynebacterium pseudotuberculosis 1002]ADO25969.2 peptide chain release factor 3 [Corynebacterium pseudotuberculosis I19]AEP69949.1 Peptide chain release factor 3 [Corynebacterium pseudotuberculosis 42/02-A]